MKLLSMPDGLVIKGWEFECPYNFIGSLPESLTQGLLVGKHLIGGLGVMKLLSMPDGRQRQLKPCS